LMGNLTSPNTPARIILLGALAVLAMTLFAAPVRALFHFDPVHIHDVGIAALAAAACVLWFELVKSLAPRWLGGSVAG